MKDPKDVTKRTEHKGAAMVPPGLDPLDEERAASLADEGGRAGATVEAQESPTRRKRPRRR